MAMNFPSSPSVGQLYTLNGSSFIWDGVRWKSLGINVLARDQNLADIVDIAAARVNLGLQPLKSQHIIGTSLSGLISIPVYTGRLYHIRGYARPQTSTVQLFMRLSTDSGASFLANSYMQHWISAAGAANGQTISANTEQNNTYASLTNTAGNSAVPAIFETLLYTGGGGVFPSWMSWSQAFTPNVGMQQALIAGYYGGAILPNRIGVGAVNSSIQGDYKFFVDEY